MSGTPTRLTMRSGRLRSSIVSAKDPLVRASTSLKPPWARAACIAASPVPSGAITITRGSQRRLAARHDAAAALARRRGDRLALATKLAAARPGRRRAHLEELQRVEQQDDLPLPGDGRAGEGPDALQEGAEILDHDLCLAEELVHDHGERLAPGSEGDDRQRPSGRAARDLEHAIQPHEVHALALDLDRLDAVHGPDLFRTDVDRPLHGRDWDRQGLRPHVHHERIGDGDGQRQTYPEARAAPRLGLHLDLAAEAADVRAHDVHADAAARGGRPRGSGGDAGADDQVEDVALAEPRQGLGRGEAAAPRGFRDGLHVDAAAVVRDLDVDRPTLVGGAEVDRALRRLVRMAAHLLGLDAVGDGVAHQMDQGIGHELDDGRVHLDRLAADLQHDALAGGPRAVTHHSDERREESADGDHARARDLTAQLAAEALDAAGVLPHDPHQTGQLVLGLREVTRDLADTAGEEVEVIVAVELEVVEELPQWRRARLGRAPARRADGRHQTVGVLRLELGDGLGHARLRERQALAGLLELDQVALQAASRDHELTDQVHQRVQSIEADADARTHPTRCGLAARTAPLRATRDGLGSVGDALGGHRRLETLGRLRDGWLARRDRAHRRRVVGGRMLDRLDAWLRRQRRPRADRRQ